MAQKVTVSLIDDLDGDKADETVEFGLDGKSYEIDLSSGNADKLRDVLAKHVAAGRPLARSSKNGRVATNRAATGSAHSRAEVQDCKKWLQDHGVTTSMRGRIATVLWNAYRAQNPAMIPGQYRGASV